jgi:NarL family two-component system response regulator YdfI
VGKKRVIVIDDHQLVLDAVTAIIDDDDDFEVVATATSGRDLVALVSRTDPDLVLLDLSLPGPDGIACLAVLREQNVRAKVVMLSGVDEPRAMRQSLEQGASAFVHKGVDPRDLVAVLRQTIEETVVSRVAAVPADAVESSRPALTKAEVAVLEALARGCMNKQIADDLSIAQQTVKFHLTNIYRKLGISSRTEAIRYAYEGGLVHERSWNYTAAAS